MTMMEEKLLTKKPSTTKPMVELLTEKVGCSDGFSGEGKLIEAEDGGQGGRNGCACKKGDGKSGFFPWPSQKWKKGGYFSALSW